MYTLYGIVLIVFLILISVTACISIALTYFRLSAEDYRWWWHSVLTAGLVMNLNSCTVSLFFLFLLSLSLPPPPLSLSLSLSLSLPPSPFSSTGLFVFAYAFFYYYKRSHMYGTLQTVEYFGYTILICYVFFLMLSTVSFFASLTFVRYMYRNLKTD